MMATEIKICRNCNVAKRVTTIAKCDLREHEKHLTLYE